MHYQDEISRKKWASFTILHLIVIYIYDLHGRNLPTLRNTE